VTPSSSHSSNTYLLEVPGFCRWVQECPPLSQTAVSFWVALIPSILLLSTQRLSQRCFFDGRVVWWTTRCRKTPSVASHMIAILSIFVLIPQTATSTQPTGGTNFSPWRLRYMWVRIAAPATGLGWSLQHAVRRYWLSIWCLLSSRPLIIIVYKAGRQAGKTVRTRNATLRCALLIGCSAPRTHLQPLFLYFINKDLHRFIKQLPKINFFLTLNALTYL